MPRRSHQPPNSLRRVSGSSTTESVNSSGGLDLPTDLERFLNEAENERSRKSRKKKIKRLMKRISSILPEDPPGLSKDDRDNCLEAIQVHITERNMKALEFLSLIKKESFGELRLAVRCFSKLTMKDKLMNPETLTVHDPCDAKIFLSQLKSITTVQPLKLPTPEEYHIFKQLMSTFNVVFDQSSEQSAVIKVAAYSILVHLQNADLCTKYFPEFNLFSITPKESAAEVVARVNTNDYRYFLTGRADGFIVSLTTEEGTCRSILADKEVGATFSEVCDDLVVPKYRLLTSRLQKMVDDLNEAEQKRVSYEIVVLEIKKIQPPAKVKWMELRSHLKQVIGECAAIHKCGPDQCRFLKFILSDGDHWLFGVLQNPETNAIGSDTQRECFYAVNSDPSLVEQVTELLAVWMAIPGNTLYDSFLGIDEQ